MTRPSSTTDSGTIRMRSAEGGTALVSCHGAQVLSWIPAGGREALYLSGKSMLDGSAPIRGGVPIIFPQFADYGPLPKHGFARDCGWRVVAREGGDESGGFARVALRLEDSPATRARWPHAFACEVSITLDASRLAISLRVENRDTAPFEFTTALHTYLRVDDIDRVRLEGLHGTWFRDRTRHDARFVETAPTLVIEAEVDRLYVGAPRRLVLTEPDRRVTLDREGFADVVVWNPWHDKARLLPDLPDDGYRSMLCVEAAAVARPLRLEPGEHWIGTQTLTASG